MPNGRSQDLSPDDGGSYVSQGALASSVPQNRSGHLSLCFWRGAMGWDEKPVYTPHGHRVFPKDPRLCADRLRQSSLGAVCPSEHTSCSCKAKKGGGGWRKGRKETAASRMKRFAKLPWLDLIAGCCKPRRTM